MVTIIIFIFLAGCAYHTSQKKKKHHHSSSSSSSSRPGAKTRRSMRVRKPGQGKEIILVLMIRTHAPTQSNISLSYRGGRGNASYMW